MPDAADELMGQLSVGAAAEVEKSVSLIIRTQNEMCDRGAIALDCFSRDLAHNIRRASAASEDLEQRLAWWYLQFVATIPSLVMATEQFRLSDGFDFVSLGLSDATEPLTGTLEVTRLSCFLDSATIPRTQAIEDILSWGRGFWRLARSFGTYTEAATLLFDFFLWLSRRYRCKFSDSISAYGACADWSIEYGHRLDALPGLAEALVECLVSPQGSDEQRMEAAQYLQGRVGQQIGFPREPAARIARTNPSAQIRLQVVVQDWLLETGTLDAIMEAMADAAAELRSIDSSALAQEGFFRVIHPVVFRLAVGGQYAELLALLSRWDAGAGDIDTPQVLIPDASGGPLLLRPVGAAVRGSGPDLQILTAAYNRFHQTTITIRGDRFEPDTPDPDRTGLVFSDDNGSYQSALRTLVEGVDIRGGASLPIAVVPHFGYPLQTVMLACGRGFSPWSVSLRRPQADAVPKRAALFCCDEMMAVLEMAQVSRLLEAGGTHVRLIPADECGIAKLRAVWEDPEYDVIWVSGHGEFSGYAPDDAHLTTGIEQLDFAALRSWRTPARTHRRLVVLNACFAGAAASLEGTGRIGLATAVAGPLQAIVAHLWNVHFLPSACFGVLLASRLHRGGFCECFEYACRSLSEGGNRLAEELSDCRAGTLAQRVNNNSSLDWQDMANWGSPCFFQ